MKKIFIDTNIVIDLLSRREPFYEEAANLFSLADKKIIELSISSLTVANTSYTLLRQTNSTSAKEILRKLRLIINILPLKGDYATMKTLNELRNSLLPNDEEVEKYGIKQVEQQVVWNQKFANIEKEYDLGKTAMRIIENKLEELDKKKEITPNLIDIYEKFMKESDSEES